MWLSAATEPSEVRVHGGMNGHFSMKTEAMSSKQPGAETENINMALPEHPKRWKSRLQRFQSSLRQSLRIKKGNSPRSASFVGGENRVDLANDNENRSSKHVRREILAKEQQHNGLSHKQLNGTKTTSHSHYQDGKTPLDSYGFDKRKFEQNKTNGNNNRNEKTEKKKAAESISSGADVRDVPSCGQRTSSLQKRTQKTKRQRSNTNTERPSLSKSKSLSILTNLFKRSSHSKDKNNRGKSSSFATAQSSVSKNLSTANSSDFDTLVTDIVVSNSSIDSYCDGDSRFKGSKYYSLKRSKRSLVFPKNNIARSFSLDNSLESADPLMERSRTLAAIPPCIRVEEYRDNCGFFERTLSVEFNPGSSGSITIDTGPEYYQNVTGCSSSCRVEVDSSGTRKNGVGAETGRNITRVAEKSSDAWKRRSAPPILSYSADKNSSNIGSPILRELKTDIATGEEESGNQFQRKSEEGQSNFSEERNSCSETGECTDFLEKSDMGNNLSYGVQKPRKFEFNPKDGKLKLAILRSIKKNGKTFREKAYDGEEDPIIEQSDYPESFERELENGGLNYPSKIICSDNEVTKDKSNSLYEGTEALGATEKMIDTFQSNNYAQDFSDVKSTIGEISGGNQPIEHGIAEEKLTCENTQPFIPNDKVNKEEEVCEENFCSSNFGQTEDNGSSQQGDCLFCGKTRRHLTADGELMPCQPPDPSRKINAGAISEQKLRDHISAELITCGLREICNGGHGLARNINRVNSLPNSPVESLLHVANSTNMHSSFPDIRKLHAHHLSPKLSDSSDSLSRCSLHVEDSFENENNSSFDSNGKKKRPSLSIDLSKCRKYGGLMRTHLGPEYQEERQRSRSARIPYRSPVQQVLKTENRSVSCSQLDKNGNNSPTSTSPPYVRPRIQSLEELPPCTAEVILRKKKSIIRKTRMKHTASLSFVDNVFNNVFDKGKRHSYGGYDDITFLQLPHLLQRSHSTESQLDSCNSSIQSLNSSSSFTENELGSTFSVMSELSIPGAFDQSLGRSRSVPGYLGVAGSPQTSPIPEERASVSDMEWPSKSDVNSDDDDDDVDGEVGCHYFYICFIKWSR